MPYSLPWDYRFMKRLYYIFLAILISAPLLGQSTQYVIEQYTGKISGFESLYATYSFEVRGGDGTLQFSTDGEFFSEGDNFLVRTGYSDIYCDGESKYIYDKGSDEVIVVGHNTNDVNMSENPFSILRRGVAPYEYPARPKVVMYEGQECYLVNLVPKAKQADHTSVDVIVTKSGFELRSISYKSRKGDTYTAKIRSVTECSPKGASFYRPDYDALGDVYVNDLR